MDVHNRQRLHTTCRPRAGSASRLGFGDRADLERKRLFGLAEAADSHSDIASGIYDRKAGRAVYDRMFDRARSMLGAGIDVILDAAFLDGQARGRAKRIAADCGADFVIVQCSIASRAGTMYLSRQRDGGSG